MGVRVVHSLDEAIEGADVVMMLRIQLERQGKLSFPSLREYYNTFGLTRERLRTREQQGVHRHASRSDEPRRGDRPRRGRRSEATR